jgi:hypothetical protein
MLARLRSHLARRAEWYWAPLLYTLAVVWIYRDAWHAGGVATGFGWDTIDTHGPDLDFFASELREGRFSLWNPYDKGGYPVFCDPVFDRYYPLAWPFAAWGALFGASWWLVQLAVLAHHVVAGATMHLFARSRGLSARAAMIGGLGLVAASPLLNHKASNVLWPIVWVPLVWLAIDAALKSPSWRRGVGVAAALALPITAGSPPGLFYALLLVAPYAVVRLVAHLRVAEHRRRVALVRLATCVGAAVAVVGLVLAVTVLPTRDLVALGSRDRLGAGTPEFALSGAIPLGPALRGTLARGAGPFEIYMGSAIVLLAACAIALRARRDGGAPIVMVAIAATGIVLAAGAATPVLPWLVAHVPGFALLRVANRYKLLAAWGLCAAAAYGAGALEVVARATKRRALWCAGAAVVLVVVLVAVVPDPAEPKARDPWWSLAPIGIAAALVAVAALAGAARRDLALSALAIVALLDAPAFFFVWPAARQYYEPRQTHAADDAIVARLDGARDGFRIYDEFVLGERAGARLRLRDFRGYPALDPISLHRYWDTLEFAKTHGGAIVTDFNVRWLLSRPHFRYGYDVLLARPDAEHFIARGGDVYEAKHPAPLVAWYGAATIVASSAPGDVLAAVRAVEEPDGARRRAVIERADAALVPRALEGAAPDARDGTLVSYEPDQIVVAIDAPRAGIVVLNEIEFPGWRVEVDGAPAEPLRANFLLRAVAVDAGHHTIEWRFEPVRWRWYVGGYVVALAIMLAAAALPRRPRVPVAAVRTRRRGGAGS